ncbi:MAG: MATE family efflux transporter [Clostridia bacterium]|nr:MATE family efflux transporter [Clostridia bacterium]
MTEGPIIPQIVAFALPLLLGNVFQLLYNTVDTLVVGNFVSTQALAAVGSTTMITNIIIFFFNGLSIGATVVIGHNYGAHDEKSLHIAVETTMTLTFTLSVFLSIIAVLLVPQMLRFMSTPEDVIPEATTYLRIYFAGVSGLLIYNMGSGILRAVGDSTRPLYFLILTSLLNIALDLFFVLALHLGIAGVAYATILSQAVSATLVVLLLTRTRDIYRLTWHDLHIHRPTLRRILGIGLPTAIQATLTSFSNVFVQSYVNVFGSACMAGWSCYNKLDQFVFLPMASVANAATTFVSQNTGAGREDRAHKGTQSALMLALSITFLAATGLFILAGPATGIFTKDQDVIRFGTLFIRMNVYFLLANSVNHVMAGALRGRGNSRAPMVCMLTGFVVIRQIYLFLATRLIANTPVVVGLGYPVGWCTVCLLELIYYYLHYGRKQKTAIPA